MPLLHQPRQLLCLSMTAASRMIISQTLTRPDAKQEARMRGLVVTLVPPPLLQDLLHSVLRQLALTHSQHASPAIITSLLRILTHPRLTELQLSDLTYLGTVEHETLEKMESSLIQLLPSMTKLTHLDMSTHLNKTTLPSCSSEVLQVLGYSCPNLRHLNLNHNNRVTSEGLLYLYPADFHPGCIKLENLYIQDCSIEPEDVAMLIHFFPNLKLIGYKELGTSIQMLKSQPRKFGRKKKKCQYRLKLTHIDNTMSRVQRCDGDIVDFVCETCPDVENLKVRVCDEDVGGLGKLPNLRHLELRFYTGVHHPIGSSTINHFVTHGSSLSSLTIYCHSLQSHHVRIIAENCYNLSKLFLHANIASVNSPLESSSNKLQKLEVLSLRLGNDELVMSPAACELVLFLVVGKQLLQELFLLVRSPGITHGFINTLLAANPLPHLKTLIIDVPRRTLAAPMLDLGLETAYLLINTCPSLHILGNLICWNVTHHQVEELQAMKRLLNYNLTILYAQSNRTHSKLL
ncbi:hypothetical protein Pcinc_026139 [Petrolisthes cinctipes]|uniref:Uncharacterized protein n=1 Tax=Petrolisthes cinctipes TaxID=88211 RepID=A0AAE1F7F8_PETCI|nr:hypothetical protein Pcinc_026139 [Petrolisthes cinctipes]